MNTDSRSEKPTTAYATESGHCFETEAQAQAAEDMWLDGLWHDYEVVFENMPGYIGKRTDEAIVEGKVA